MACPPAAPPGSASAEWLDGRYLHVSAWIDWQEAKPGASGGFAQQILPQGS